jgi:hypothetical protein
LDKQNAEKEFLSGLLTCKRIRTPLFDGAVYASAELKTKLDKLVQQA